MATGLMAAVEAISRIVLFACLCVAAYGEGEKEERNVRDEFEFNVNFTGGRFNSGILMKLVEEEGLVKVFYEMLGRTAAHEARGHEWVVMCVTVFVYDMDLEIIDLERMNDAVKARQIEKDDDKLREAIWRMPLEVEIARRKVLSEGKRAKDYDWTNVLKTIEDCKSGWSSQDLGRAYLSIWERLCGFRIFDQAANYYNKRATDYDLVLLHRQMARLHSFEEALGDLLGEETAPMPDVLPKVKKLVERYRNVPTKDILANYEALKRAAVEFGELGNLFDSGQWIGAAPRPKKYARFLNFDLDKARREIGKYAGDTALEGIIADEA